VAETMTEAEQQAREDYRTLQSFVSIDSSLIEKALAFQKAALDFWKEYAESILRLWHPKN
jgi:hypothetical protein